MSEAYLVRRGGGMSGTVKKGTIVVEYPEGSVCTVTNGGKTYTALDTSGAAAFIVDPGTWTVTAVKGEQTKSETVEITTVGQVVSVELYYELVLYDKGYLNDIVGGFTVGSYTASAPNITLGSSSLTIAYSTGTAGAVGMVRTGNKINLTDYKTLKIQVKALSVQYSSADRYFNFMLTTSASANYDTGSPSKKVYGSSGGAQTVSLDISGLNDTAGYYFGVGLYSYNYTMSTEIESIIAYP